MQYNGYGGGSKAALFLRRNELRLYGMPFESFWGSVAAPVICLRRFWVSMASPFLVESRHDAIVQFKGEPLRWFKG